MQRTTHTIFNILLFIGLVGLNLVTIIYIILLWPSLNGNTCNEFCGMDIVNPERRYFILVALGGVLGSFIHIATSFVDFLGNKKMVSSWIPWYIMRPFIGAGLALIFYVLLRGGIVSTHPIPSLVEETAGKAAATINPQESRMDSILKVGKQIPTIAQVARPATHDLPFNPFGIMAIALLAGMFSKQATDKLREVFESVFNIKSGTPRKDGLQVDNNGNTGSTNNGDSGTTETPV